MANQINYDAEEASDVTPSLNVVYGDMEESSDIEIFRKEGCTMPTTGGGI